MMEYMKAESKDVKLEIDTREINPVRSRYPYCIVWTPIPIITWLLPFIGHVGICTSEGIAHDFAGSYHIGIDHLAFGEPHKYCVLEVDDSKGQIFDTAIERADEVFRHKIHALCWYELSDNKSNSNNCHSHVARALSFAEYKNKHNYNMFSVWWMTVAKTHYVTNRKLFKTYAPFLAIVLLIVIAILLFKYL